MWSHWKTRTGNRGFKITMNSIGIVCACSLWYVPQEMHRPITAAQPSQCMHTALTMRVSDSWLGV